MVKQKRGKKDKNNKSVSEITAQAEPATKIVDPSNWQAFKDQKVQIMQQMEEIKKLKAMKTMDAASWQSFKEQK